MLNTRLLNLSLPLYIKSTRISELEESAQNVADNGGDEI